MSRRRRIELILVVLAVSICVARTSHLTLHPGTVQRLELLRLQSYCLNYEPPANYPVLAFSYPPVAPVPPLVPSQFKYVQRAPLAMWDDYYVRIGRPSASYDSGNAREPTNLFVHSLTSKSGHYRLVAVDLCVFERYELVVTVIEPGTFAVPPRIIDRYVPRYRIGDGCTDLLDAVPGSYGRFFAGHHDPTDPSHFTASFMLYGKTEILDGRLGDDDLVAFSVRDAGKARERVRAMEKN